MAYKGEVLKTLDQKLWEKVEPMFDDRGCWEFNGTLDAFGYGQIKHQGRKLKAHRVAWELTNGPITAAEKACHRCDNRSCVNPSHIFIGTQQDNLKDMHAKGRGAYPFRGKTHCGRGHKYVEDSYYLLQKRNERVCKACYNLRREKYKGMRESAA